MAVPRDKSAAKNAVLKDIHVVARDWSKSAPQPRIWNDSRKAGRSLVPYEEESIDFGSPALESHSERGYRLGRESRHGTGSVFVQIGGRALAPGKLCFPEYEAHPLADIEGVIAESESLLQLSEDWDDEGALPIERRTWEQATEALRSIATAMHRKTGSVIPEPTIGPCADGSIDLFWETGAFKLLINIKPDAAESDYYGETTKGHVIKGPFETSEVMYGLLQALIK
jgi:hypothetical protein